MMKNKPAKAPVRGFWQWVFGYGGYL